MLERSVLGPLSKLSAGGQGTVYRAPKVVINSTNAAVYKEYKPEVLRQLDVAALDRMATFLRNLPFNEGSSLYARAAWPANLVGEAGTLRGFVMAEVPSAFWLDLQVASGVKRALGQFQHLLNDDQFLAGRGLPLSDRLRIELLIDLCETLAFFHTHDIAVGDLSAKNLLFSFGPPARCFFIDCDAMRLRGSSVMPQLETPDWDVRCVSSEELATKQSDVYKLGLLAVRLFGQSQSIRSVAEVGSRYPGELRAVTTASLDSDPSKRPRAEDWLAPLALAIKKASTTVPTTSAKPAARVAGAAVPPAGPTAHGAAAPIGGATPGVIPPTHGPRRRRRRRRSVLVKSVVLLAALGGAAAGVRQVVLSKQSGTKTGVAASTTVSGAFGVTFSSSSSSSSPPPTTISSPSGITDGPTTVVAPASTVPTTAPESAPLAAAPEPLAVGVARSYAAALAGHDWDAARALNPRLPDDATLDKGYRYLNRQFVVDWQTTPTDSNLNELRLLVLANEAPPNGEQSSFWCFHWEIDAIERTVRSVDGKRLQTFPGTLQPTDLPADLAGTCQALDLR